MTDTIDWAAYNDVLDDAHALAERKSTDYGVSSLTDFGEIGCLIRLNDKVNRLKQILQKGTVTVTEETVEDTCLDLINYAA